MFVGVCSEIISTTTINGATYHVVDDHATCKRSVIVEAGEDRRLVSRYAAPYSRVANNLESRPYDGGK